MTITGIVAEFNPFHLGHKRLLEEARRMTGADWLVVVMSGAFTERGDCAAFSVKARAEAALLCGADVVLELPVRTSSAGAEDYTRGSVYALHSMGCVDFICFGSESGDIDELKKAAEVIGRIDTEAVNRSSPHRNNTYAQALGDYLVSIGEEEVSQVMASPNNVLAMGYLAALDSLGSGIRACTVKRDRNDDHYSSSSEIRRALSDGDRKYASEHLPVEMLERIPDCACSGGLITNDDFSLLLFKEIQYHSAEEISFVYECSEDLARRIKKLCRPGMSFMELVKSVKSKDLTESRVRRVLMHLVLGLFGAYNEPSYVRLIGCRSEAEDALSEIRSRSSIPVITRLSDLRKQESIVKAAFDETDRALKLWEEVWYLKYGTQPERLNRVLTV